MPNNFSDIAIAPGSARDSALPQSAVSITERHEHIWLQQQQEPGTVLAALLGFRLTGKLDATRLIRALEELPAAIPQLAHSLVMTDDGELCARPAHVSARLHHAISESEAVLALQELQTAPWDPESETPFRCALVLLPDGAMLGLAFHALAGGAEVANAGLHALTALYNGSPLPYAVKPGPALPQGKHPPGADALAGLRSDIRVALPQPIRLVLETTTSTAELANQLAAAFTEVTGTPAPDIETVAHPLPDLALALPLESSLAVAQLTHPALSLDRVTVTRQPLDTAFTGTGLLVGLRGNTGLEMLAGHDISPMAAGLVLERCAARLKSGAADIPSVVPSIPVTTAEATVPAANASPDLQQVILSEFRAALHDDNLGPEDDFFDFGGHSLTATRVIGRLLDKHGIEIHLCDLFSHSSAASLAGRATRTGPEPCGEVPAQPEPASDAPVSAPLSLAQASLWRAYAGFGYGDIFNIPFGLRFLDPVDETVFAQAFRDVLERHPVLRSLFSDKGGKPRQTVVPMADLDSYRWFWSSSEADGATRSTEAAHVFDLARELPLRLRFLAENGEQILSMLFHHVVLDEWSVGLLIGDLARAYASRAAGNAPVWPETPAPFHEFAARQDAAGPNEAHLGFWAEMLRGAPEAAPLFGSAEGDSSPAGGWVELRVEPEIAEGLYALAKAENASPFNVVYAGIAAALHWLGGIDDLLIGTSASGRLEAEFFDTIGYFTTMVAHRTRFAKGVTARALVGQVRDMINGSMPQADIPLDLVSERLTGQPQPMDRIFEAFIQIHARNPMNGSFDLPDGKRIRFRQIDPEKAESILGLQFEVVEDVIGQERSLRVMMSYRSDRYGETDVKRITATVGETFRLLADPAQAALPLSELAARALR
ncbi:condensation domain-containing protein [Paracoccus onubensis]|uniref:condensation domain-containing protein n=1 Tax=Paracoccus onubensis TaxID=1675788 RepID=UPI00272F1D4D|nr:condensation domain-containing protein [Paracoccus onubensis]MDP0926335.1 condensation domain-containing protein [Paracoccus onubensis]